MINRLIHFFSGKRESRVRDSLYSKLNYYFRSETLIETALTHRSVTGERGTHWDCNERLEFLGDAVLGMVVSELLYRQYPRSAEGELTRRKSHLVCRESLAEAARRIELGRYIILSPGEENTGGRERDSILADTLEAVIGAIYLEGGLKAAASCISAIIVRDGDTAEHSIYFNNYKSFLLEYVQSRGMDGPAYEVAEASGPDHEKVFTVNVYIDSNLAGSGQGLTKKKAEQAAARMAVRKLGLTIR